MGTSVEYQVRPGYEVTVKSLGGRSARIPFVEVTLGDEQVILDKGERWAFAAGPTTRVLKLHTRSNKGPARCREDSKESFFWQTHGGRKHVIRYELSVEDKNDEDWNDNYVSIEIMGKVSSEADEADAQSFVATTRDPTSDYAPLT